MEEALAFLLLIYGGSTFTFSQPAGETICLQKCASCHGMNVQSVKGKYEDALDEDWSVGKIKTYIGKKNA